MSPAQASVVDPARPPAPRNETEGVVSVTEIGVSPTALSESGTARPEERPRGPATEPAAPAAAGPSGWTGGRITALVIGALLVLISVGLLGTGGTALWADLIHRDAAGYVTTDVHAFSTAGSALETEPVELGSPGVGWLYSTVVLGEVRIRVTPVSPGSTLYVGIGPSAAVDRYLAGVSHTLISDFWGNRVQAIGGSTPTSAPGRQDFWVASATGTGAQTLRWDPANGSWTVVVMNADGRPGVHAAADLGATMPTLMGIVVGSLVVGGVFLVGGALLIGGAIRRSRARGARTL
jgi:hypothetical protein